VSPRARGSGPVPTIRDVAKAAGVSRGTVSRVLNGGHWVSPAAAAAVEAAMQQTGYVASHSARSLASGRSGAVALVVTETQERLFEDPTFSWLVKELGLRLRSHGLTLFIALADDTASRAGLVRQLRGGLLDGIVLASTHGDDPLFAELLAIDAAAVVFGHPLGRGIELPYVTTTNLTGAAGITQHLMEIGRRRIAIITGPLDTSGAQQRLAGYRLALGARVDEALFCEAAEYSRQAGRAAMQELLGRQPALDAVFAASDLLADGAMAALAARGLRIPVDVAVAGFDDSMLARTATPPLSTVHTPRSEVADALVRVLVDRIEGRRPAAVELATRLELRESTGVPSGPGQGVPLSE
jgi:DNA-binding LacI/PurR family transcriptional regulator